MLWIAIHLPRLPLDAFLRASPLSEPPLWPVGCAGRISSFAETDDGRFLITLTGVCRFRIGRELDGVRG